MQLTGSRKAKAAAREDNNSSKEDSSEDKDYKTKEEDDIELDEAFDNKEDSIDAEEEEEEAMPPKRAAAKKAEAKIDDVTRSMSAMSVSRAEPFKEWSMDYSFPFMIKKFLHDGRESCSIKLILPPIH